MQREARESLRALDEIERGDLDAAFARLGRVNSEMLGTRVTKPQARAFRALCKRQGVAPGVMLRRIVALAIAKPGADPAQILARIARILGMPEDTEPRAIVEAVSAIVEEIPPPGDALDESGGGSPPAALSAPERKAAAKIKDPNQRAAFVALRAERVASRARTTPDDTADDLRFVAQAVHTECVRALLTVASLASAGGRLGGLASALAELTA